MSKKTFFIYNFKELRRCLIYTSNIYTPIDNIELYLDNHFSFLGLWHKLLLSFLHI